MQSLRLFPACRSLRRAASGRALAAAGRHAAPRPLLLRAAPAAPAESSAELDESGMVSYATDSKDSPFNELGLLEIMRGMGKVRVRQHVNPLRAEYQKPLGSVDWAATFDDPTLPLVVDLGCGPGRFLLLLQRRAAERAAGAAAGVPQGGGCNFLGIEIRRALVDRANQWAEQLQVQGRVHYIFTNASISLEGMLAGYPGPVEAFFVQFPDPHFKRRHRKRRLLQPDTVCAMRDALRPGGRVFLQSDILRAAEGLRDAVEEAASESFEPSPLHSDPANVFHARSSGGGGEPIKEGAAAGDASAEASVGALSEETVGLGFGTVTDSDGEAEPLFVSEWAAAGWLRDNPVGVPTEREHYVAVTQGADVYRVLLVKR